MAPRLNVRAWCLIGALMAAPLMAVASERHEQAAKNAALAWLALVDEARYDASWTAAASLLRQQVGTRDWVKAVTAARAPMGDLITRRLTSATYTTHLPGAPDGEYVVLQFQTHFANKAQAIETVTPMLDGDRWRVAGYYVR